MSSRQRLLLLQLPRLDPDVTSPGENVMLAAACLQSVLVRTPEGRHWELLPTPATQDTADNAALLAAVLAQKPDVIGATLYLWNVERTLRLLAALKQHLPQVKTVAGGPEVAREHPILFSQFGPRNTQNLAKACPCAKRPDKLLTVAAAAGRGLRASAVESSEFAQFRVFRGQQFSPVDIAVVGEGETVFPSILSALRRNTRTDWRNVAWLEQAFHTRPAADGRLQGVPFAGAGGPPPESFSRPQAAVGGAFGTRPPPALPLIELLPPADHPVCRPDAHGMAYLETNRGCPMRCAFCCYNLRRRGWSSLPPAEVEHRIRVLRQRGTREIRLVDPTFNAHPRFRQLLGAMRRTNHDRKLKFFVELRADTLTEQDAAALAAAGIVEAEVGVQSTDPAVLRCIHRPTNLERTLAGIERLQRHGIKPTIDFMYGLPRQGMDDIERSLAVLERFPKAHQQFLPTLLLPGTELRDRARELKLRAQPLPPYRVIATDRLTTKQLAAIEALARERLGGFDSPTRRFVGRTLPDLFVARQWVEVRQMRNAERGTRGSPSEFRVPSSGFAEQSTANRRAVIFRGDNLFAQRQAMTSHIRECARREPDILWQFLLAPTREEPLDLLDALIATIRTLPPHWIDRLVSPAGTQRLAARRLFVMLPKGKRFDAGWIDAAEELLQIAFH